MTVPPSLPAACVHDRLNRLRELLVEGDEPPGALLVTALANVRYLTGFTGSAGTLLVTPDEALLTTDGRYRTQAAEQLDAVGVAGAVDLVVGGVPAQRQAIADRGAGLAQVGLEAEHVTWGAQRRWREALEPAVTAPTSGMVERLREVKDEGELLRMERAAAIADAALAEVVDLLRREPTEAEVAIALDTAMRRGGAEDRAFETIVASGPNAAKPHARPSGRRIERGDPVVVDFGAMFEGYRSDMTRSFVIGGEPTGDLARVFAVVGEAQAAGVAAVKPGVSTGEIDQTCRERIAAAGWAEAFEHGTGHGVGLDIHEAPSVAPGGAAILAPGVVVTVEPGVYLAGVGGVRIEDTVVVTVDGCRPLTTFPKDPVAV